MARHGMLRARPHELLPGTLRVISVRMNYLPAKAAFASTLQNPQLGYVSRYALGRDYHKLLRQRLKKAGRSDPGLLRRVEFPPLCRFRAGDGTRAGRQGGHRLGW